MALHDLCLLLLSLMSTADFRKAVDCSPQGRLLAGQESETLAEAYEPPQESFPSGASLWRGRPAADSMAPAASPRDGHP